MCRVGLVGWDLEMWFSATDVDVLFSGTENMISVENISLHLMQLNRTQLRPFLMLQKSLFRSLSIFSSKMSSPSCERTSQSFLFLNKNLICA